VRSPGTKGFPEPGSDDVFDPDWHPDSPVVEYYPFEHLVKQLFPPLLEYYVESAHLTKFVVEVLVEQPSYPVLEYSPSAHLTKPVEEPPSPE